MLRSGRRHCCQQYVVLAFQAEFDLTKLHFPFDSTLERHRGDKVSAFTWEIDHQSSIWIARICRVRSTQIEHDFLSADEHRRHNPKLVLLRIKRFVGPEAKCGHMVQILSCH